MMYILSLSDFHSVEKTYDNKGNLLNCSIKVKVTTTDRYDAETTYKNHLKIKFNLLWKEKKPTSLIHTDRSERYGTIDARVIPV